MTIYYPIKAYDPHEAYFAVLASDGEVWQESRTLDGLIEKTLNALIGKSHEVIPVLKQFCLSYTPHVTHIVRDTGRIDQVSRMDKKQSDYFSVKLMHGLESKLFHKST